MMTKVYIVMCPTIYNGDFLYYIDSVWMNEKKATKRNNILNSIEKEGWREEFGYGLFEAEQQCISK